MPTTMFSMRIDSDMKKALEDEAALQDRSAAYIAQHAIRSWLDNQEAKREAIREAIAEAGSGVFYSQEAIAGWMSRWAQGEDAAFPEPDILPDAK